MNKVKRSRPSSGGSWWLPTVIVLAIVSFTALGLGIAGLVVGNTALERPAGFGNAFTEASTSVVNLTDAPGVSTIFVIFGCSLFPSGTGFGSMSGTLTVTSSGPQQIQFIGPLSSVVGSPVSVGAIPGLIVLAVDGSTTFPADFAIFPTDHDILLNIPNITPGTYSFTQPFYGVSKD